MEDLKPLKKIKNLEELYLQNTPINSLEAISGMSKLDSLGISNTQITSLAPLKNLRNLKRLYCENLPLSKQELEKELADFKKKHPNCKIILEGI